ncbi:MAG: helix-turn-helix transcriptional regulator [Clostridia bacterium]|nr:helix-turn-helix transcriptional regulator [Clostridia bacterium]
MRLKELREDSDITQKYLADLLHIKQNTYSQYENGQRQPPLEVLISLAKFYKVTLDYLVGISDIKNPYKN